MRLDESDMHERRQANLRAMKSPASLLLLAASISAVLLAVAFHDHPIINNDQISSYLRSAATTGTR
jgi:hypothetical protein